MRHRTITDQPLSERLRADALPTLGRASSADASRAPRLLPLVRARHPGRRAGQHTQILSGTSICKGNHQLRFGGQYVNIQINNTFGAFLNSVLNLGATNAQGYSNLVAGQLIRFQGAVDPQGGFPGDFVTTPLSPPSFSRSYRYHEWAGYINDSWRVSPSVRKSRLRYEYTSAENNNRRSTRTLLRRRHTTRTHRNGSVQSASGSSVGLWSPINTSRRASASRGRDGAEGTPCAGLRMASERNCGNVPST